MNRNPFIKRSLSVVVCGLAVLTTFVAAQRTQPTPTVVVNAPKQMTVVGRNSLYCAGYVQSSPMNTDDRIVGAVEEQEQFHFAQNDLVYVNLGSTKGVRAGDVMAVVRPRGQVDTRWTKKSDLGFFVQEVGAIEILKVREDNLSVARIKASCEVFMLGDLVQPMPERTSPMHQDRGPLEPFIAASGKAQGRLFMARDGAELLTRDQIVYIDLGEEDNAKVGDRVTVFRPLGKGALFISDEKESMSARDGGFQSNEYRGGGFSISAARKSGDKAGGSVVTTERAKEDRPQIRKVVGELVILNVKEKTATAVITRTVQEIHPGDWVELQ